MTTIRQLIQTTPAIAIELLGKLVGTSTSAVKTRERLFGELQEELERLATLEEQHLFPVLRKHKALKALVREALADNKATRKLLAELENTPRDTEEFSVRVAELSKVFQQHVRAEKSDLLPAILEALTEEEAKSVVQRYETQIAEVEEAKRTAATERRAEARRERKKLVAQQARLKNARHDEAQHRRFVARQERQVAEQSQIAMETPPTEAGLTPSTAQQTEAIVQVASHDGVTKTLMRPEEEQVEHVFSALLQQHQEIVEQAAMNLRILMGGRNQIAANIQNLTAAYFDANRKQLETNLAGMGVIFASRTMMELLAAQTALFRNQIK